MSFRYQIVYWRDIPAQIKGKAGRQRISRMLAQRFQVAIDEAAMRDGTTDTDAYLDEWRSTDWQEHDGEPEPFLDNLVAEIEGQYPGKRLKALMDSGGYEPKNE